MTVLLTAGVDEVGRGCLAGPVVAAAVIFPPKPSWEWLKLENYLPEIKDSKLLTKKKRSELSQVIRELCDYSIAEVSASAIDSYGILNSTLLAMRNSIYTLHQKPELVLVDGPIEIPSLGIDQRTVVDGDKIEKTIGAASIIAKVYRDTLMTEISPSYPAYGFEKHKGYGTSFHKEAIATYGPTDLHRVTFRGVSEYVRA